LLVFNVNVKILKHLVTTARPVA